jgi:hypothetical protein
MSTASSKDSEQTGMNPDGEGTHKAALAVPAASEISASRPRQSSGSAAASYIWSIN